MQNVQPLGFVAVEQCGYHWIDISLDGSVAQSENDAAPVKQSVSFRLRGCQLTARHPMDRAISGKGHSRIDHVAHEREDHCHLITNPINKQAEHNDTDSKWPDTCSPQFA